MIRKRLHYDEIALVGYGIALLIAGYLVFFQKLDNKTLNQEENLMSLVELAEKEGRWSDAAMLRGQIEKLRNPATATNKDDRQATPQTGAPELQPLNPTDKIRDWKQASYLRRLALCVGIADVANRGKQVKYSAQDYMNCIEEATRGLNQTDDLVIFDVARACDAIMRGKPG